MLNTDDSQSIAWFIDEKIKPLKKQIKKLQLDNKELKEKFSLYGVVSSSCDMSEVELRNRIRFNDMLYASKKEKS
jgi:hypothetical protein